MELIPIVSDPSETYWRQLKFQEFEISAMSSSSYLISRSRGSDMVALPVFPSPYILKDSFRSIDDATSLEVITSPVD